MLRTATDVTVIGGGPAGWAAAVAAAECGATVHLIETALELGGTLSISAGLVWAPKSMAVARDLIPGGSPVLLELLVGEVDAVWDWLVRLGLPLLSEHPFQERTQPDGTLDHAGRGRFLGVGEVGSREEFAALMAGVLDSNDRVRTHLGASATRIERHDGGWRVHLGEGADPPYMDSRAVVLATGGFASSPELLRTHATRYARGLSERNVGRNRGFGLRVATAVGGVATGHMNSFYGHTMPDTRTPVPKASLLIASHYYTDHCMLVNVRGDRFAEEWRGEKDSRNALLGGRQPNARFFVIFDARVRELHVDTQQVAGIKCDPIATTTALGGDLIESGTWAGLEHDLSKRGVDIGRLRVSFQQFRSGKPVGEKLTRMEDGPFVAVPAVSGVTLTHGGIAVDQAMRVVAGDGRPVSGAYCAGADVGGVFSRGNGGALAWAFVSGRQAGFSAAEHRGPTRSERAASR